MYRGVLRAEKVVGHQELESIVDSKQIERALRRSRNFGSSYQHSDRSAYFSC